MTIISENSLPNLNQLAIMVPVYNEEKILQENINRLYNFLEKNLPIFEIIILDSYSSDRTGEIAQAITEQNPKIKYLNIKSPGKGGKIKYFVMNYDYDNYAFIDADLPIQLERFLTIINSVVNQEVDLAIASRYVPGAQSKRKFVRKIASKVYNSILNFCCNLPTHDAFAGAKSWNKRIKHIVWPNVKNLEWFFDTELIYYTTKNKYKIKEIPVTYQDFRGNSKLNLVTDSFRIGQALISFMWNKRR